VKTAHAMDHILSPAFELIAQNSQMLKIKIREGVSNNEVLQYFIQNNIQILEFHEILPSLNEIFIRLVEQGKASRQFQKDIA
jgi:ABC-2 type transport system ATP-binding protein